MIGNKMKLNALIGLCIFFAIPLYYLSQNKNWENIELDIYNFYLSIQLPKECKIVQYNTKTRSGEPMLGTVFLVSENFNIETVKKQLEKQKWKFISEKFYTKIEKTAKYNKFGYQYGLTNFDKNKWGESVIKDD